MYVTFVRSDAAMQNQTNNHLYEVIMFDKWNLPQSHLFWSVECFFVFFVIPIRITSKQTATSLFWSTWKLHCFRLGCRKWIHDYVLIQFDLAHWIYANISFIFENANTNNRSLDCWFFLFVTISSFKWSRFIRADYVWYCSEFDMISFTNPS